jgi:hypothetical protein
VEHQAERSKDRPFEIQTETTMRRRKISEREERE